MTVAPGRGPCASVTLPDMLDVVTCAIKVTEATIARKKVSNFFIDS